MMYRALNAHVPDVLWKYRIFVIKKLKVSKVVLKLESLNPPVCIKILFPLRGRERDASSDAILMILLLRGGGRGCFH